MPTHLYCLLPAGNDSAPPVDEPAVRALATGGIVAWVGDTVDDRLPRDRTKATREAVEHDRIVGLALARGTTPIPASLGDPYPTDEAVLSDISGRMSEIRELLATVDGAVEMAVILSVSTRPHAGREVPDAAHPGRAYLEQLRDLPAVAAAAADAVDARLGESAIARTRRTDGARVGLSHLIKRDQVDAYRKAALSCLSDRYRMLVDGPRAPYSFAAFSAGPESGQRVQPPRHEFGSQSRDERN
jgi:hypothetical protein